MIDNRKLLEKILVYVTTFITCLIGWFIFVVVTTSIVKATIMIVKAIWRIGG